MRSGNSFIFIINLKYSIFEWTTNQILNFYKIKWFFFVSFDLERKNNFMGFSTLSVNRQKFWSRTNCRVSESKLMHLNGKYSTIEHLCEAPFCMVLWVYRDVALLISVDVIYDHTRIVVSTCTRIYTKVWREKPCALKLNSLSWKRVCCCCRSYVCWNVVFIMRSLHWPSWWKVCVHVTEYMQHCM